MANPSVADQDFYRSGEFVNPTVVEIFYQDFYRSQKLGESYSSTKPRSGEFENPTDVETTYQDFHRNWVFGKFNSGENMKPLVMSERLLTLASTYLHG